ncbi:asparagine synthetase domain-containing protein 1 [Olea europaea var. sylvestris]|uniref:asparagine synthetase domain-containing protein 1 n=1 Tax=Olea europaea var. sylvestris TaxID=158386 RepID=UPI000C1D8A00|nr:asparagine synthetase domain-containing protein 1 [Olea europaea var. sylvestris]
MCGIALIVCGIKIDLSLLIPNLTSTCPQFSQNCPLFSEDDIKATLQRRGPDSLGTRNILLHPKIGKDCSTLSSSVENEGSAEDGFGSEVFGKLQFIGATLQLRGVNPVVQPLVDASCNVLIFNGEIFGGIHLSSDSNDTEVLMQSMEQCCSCVSHENNRYSCPSGGRINSVPELLSQVKGPWALVYWQDSSKTLWFGRDAFGRRSLLVHWPTPDDSRLLLSSVSSCPSSHQSYDFDDEGMLDFNFWEELSCGVYSVSVGSPDMDEYLIGKVQKHEWTDSELKELITWERTAIQPKLEDSSASFGKVSISQNDRLSSLSSELGSLQITPLPTSQKVLIALRESVMRRTSLYKIFKAFPIDHRQERYAPVAVLFSGGLDSMIIAALLHQCIDPEYEIDLLNVSFDGESAPDRISARAGLKELQKNAPLRRWNLVEIDADLLKLTCETKRVMSLITPAKTYMDLNIGLALWLAAGGDGWLSEVMSSAEGGLCQRVKYKSEARILLVGSGADEQCAGYGRHRTKYRNGSWLGLHEEMKLDMQRIWKRNLGRDDRCIADNAKEARFPFLDEDVIRILLDIPLWEIADLNQPSGTGDKKILREVARLLGLNEAAILPKRAIQFGSRIARESNRQNFGSNRSANQASAGSAVIYRPSN